MRKSLSIIIGILMLAASALAQSQATTGNIEGRVLDPNGAAIPNVNVSATNKDNGFGKTGMADAEGNFVFGGIAGVSAPQSSPARNLLACRAHVEAGQTHRQRRYARPQTNSGRTVLVNQVR